MKNKILFNSIFVLVFALSFSVVNAEDHNINVSNPSKLTVVNASSFSYKPGDVFCIKAGNYAEFRFIGFHGSADKPLVFKNCGGSVVIKAVTYPGVQFKDSTFVKVTGTGSGDKYGLHISKTKDGVAGVSISDLSSDFEIENLEISNAGFAGIIAKTDPECDNPKTWRENFTMRNLNFHNNYIHDVGGEGFYVGGTFGYETSKKKCDGVERFAHLLENVKIHHNVIENTGWDGLQLNLTLVGAEVYNNTINGYGTKKEFAQNQGISIGSSRIKLYNNKIIQKKENAIKDSYGISMVSPFPGTYVFNNIVVESGDHGIWAHVRTPSKLMNDLSTKGFYFINNTIIRPGRSGIFYNSRDGADARGNIIHEFYNNLIVDPKSEYSDSGSFWKKGNESFIDYNDKEQKNSAVLSNNLFSRKISELLFADISSNNFYPLKGSPLIDKGKDVSTYLVKFDYSNNSRPKGEAFDIGAYEYVSGKETTKPVQKNSETKTVVKKDNIVNTKKIKQFTNEFSFGSKGDEVKKFQTFLKDQGLYNSKLNGKFGFFTKKAVKKFQEKYKSEGLEVNGVWDLKTLQKANSLTL